MKLLLGPFASPHERRPRNHAVIRGRMVGVMITATLVAAAAGVQSSPTEPLLPSDAVHTVTAAEGEVGGGGGIVDVSENVYY